MRRPHRPHLHELGEQVRVGCRPRRAGGSDRLHGDEVLLGDLLVGGTADRAWDPKATRDLERDLERDCPKITCMEIDEVDHALETSPNPVNSVEVLKRVVQAMERFVADQVHTV
jgi:hypothetical protein